MLLPFDLCNTASIKTLANIAVPPTAIPARINEILTGIAATAKIAGTEKPRTFRAIVDTVAIAIPPTARTPAFPITFMINDGVSFIPLDFAKTIGKELTINSFLLLIEH